LQEMRGITISIPRRGNPHYNAIAESFMKSLKYERKRLHREDYEDQRPPSAHR
jgi:transposase InsO family protein